MSVLNPLALALSALLGVLVLLYLWERLRRRVDVPSLLLWHAVPEDPIQLRRFRADWVFLLQLLLLTALLLGLARPYVAGTPIPARGGRHIVIIDVSASMQAREPAGTRLHLAQARAEALVRGLDDEAEAMLITAAAHPDIAVNPTRDRAAVIRAIRALEPFDTGTNVSTAVALALRARARDPEHTEIALFTDLPLTALDPRDRGVVRHYPIGTSDDNVAIAALQIFQGPFEEPSRARAYVLVRNFAYGERHGVLTVSVGEAVVARAGFTIPGRSARTFPVRDLPGPGLLTAAIDVDDALAADNRAFGWIRGAGQTRVLLVSQSSPLIDALRGIARAVPGMQLDRVAPEEYAPAEASGFDVVVFYRVAPALPAANALYVYPQTSTALFRVLGARAGVEVVDWNERHAGLQGVRLLPPYPLKAVQLVRPRPESELLVWSRTADGELPLAFTDTIDGHRRACIAFDLAAEPLLAGDNVDQVVFLVGLLDWLAPGDGIAPMTIATGDSVVPDDFPTDTPVTITDPAQRTRTVPRELAQEEARHAGVYTVSTNGTRRGVIANFFDAAESDIGRGDTAPAVPAVPARPALRPVIHEFGRWLYAAAAGLMLLEWAAWRRRQ